MNTGDANKTQVLGYAVPVPTGPAWHRVVWWLLILAIGAVYGFGALLIVAFLVLRIFA